MICFNFQCWCNQFFALSFPALVSKQNRLIGIVWLIGWSWPYLGLLTARVMGNTFAVHFGDVKTKLKSRILSLKTTVSFCSGIYTVVPAQFESVFSSQFQRTALLGKFWKHLKNFVWIVKGFRNSAKSRFQFPSCNKLPGFSVHFWALGQFVSVLSTETNQINLERQVQSGVAVHFEQLSFPCALIASHESHQKRESNHWRCKFTSGNHTTECTMVDDKEEKIPIIRNSNSSFSLGGDEKFNGGQSFFAVAVSAPG